MDNTLLGVLVGGGLALLANFINGVVNRADVVRQLKHRTEEEKRIHRRNRIDHLHESLCAHSILMKKYRFFLLDFISKSREEKNRAANEFWHWFSIVADPLAEINSIARLYLPQASNELSELLNQIRNVINAATDLYLERVSYNDVEKEISLHEARIRQILNAIEANCREGTSIEINRLE